jgi:hypothetical protein
MQNKIIAQRPEIMSEVEQQVLVGILKKHIEETADHGLPVTIDSLHEYASQHGFKNVRRVISACGSLRGLYHWLDLPTLNEDRIFFVLIEVLERPMALTSGTKDNMTRVHTIESIVKYFGSYENGVYLYQNSDMGSPVKRPILH